MMPGKSAHHALTATGSASVVVLGVMLCFALAFTGAVVGGAGADAATRAQATADLAALAAAQQARSQFALGAGAARSQQAPCQIAAEVASQNGVGLTGCQVRGMVVSVHVAASIGGGPLVSAVTVTRSSRAGPASAR